jgi:hypothetical protein
VIRVSGMKIDVTTVSHVMILFCLTVSSDWISSRIWLIVSRREVTLSCRRWTRAVNSLK